MPRKKSAPASNFTSKPAQRVKAIREGLRQRSRALSDECAFTRQIHDNLQSSIRFDNPPAIATEEPAAVTTGADSIDSEPTDVVTAGSNPAGAVTPGAGPISAVTPGSLDLQKLDEVISSSRKTLKRLCKTKSVTTPTTTIFLSKSSLQARARPLLILLTMLFIRSVFNHTSRITLLICLKN